MLKELTASRSEAGESIQPQNQPPPYEFAVPSQGDAASRRQAGRSEPYVPPRRPYSPPFSVNPLNYIPPGKVFGGATVVGMYAGGIAGPPAFAIVGQATPHFQHPGQYPFWGDASKESGSITGLRAGVGVAGAIGGEAAGVIGGAVAGPVLVAAVAATAYTGAQAVNACHFAVSKLADGVNSMRHSKNPPNQDIEMG